MRNKIRNDSWFFIEASNHTRRGYWPGKDEADACKRFGLKAEECSVKRVEWSGKEFLEVNQSKQERLL